MTARRWIVFVAAGVAGVCAVAVAVSRLVTLPSPSGPYAVGTMLLSAEGLPARGLQVWYPTRATAGTHAAYQLERHGHLLNPLRFVQTAALLNAEVAPGPFPLLVYVPGWRGIRTENTALVQDLASHGFVVVAFDDLHPERPMDFSSDELAQATIAWSNQKVELLASAARRTIDAMALANTEPGGPFEHRIDTARIGMLGFSFGGAVAAETTRHDRRVRAAADLDGWLFGEAATQGVTVPFLVFSGKLGPEPGAGPEARFDALNQREMTDALRRNGGYLLEIASAGHDDFTDRALLPSLHRDALGRIDGKLAHELVSGCIVTFFDRYLRDGKAALPANLDATVRVQEFR